MGRPGIVVLEDPDEQQNDDDERNETATNVHSGLLYSVDAGTTAQAEGRIRPLATMGARGDVAEWLGRGLQSLVQRFESARRLLAAQDEHLRSQMLIALRSLKGRFAPGLTPLQALRRRIPGGSLRFASGLTPLQALIRRIGPGGFHTSRTKSNVARRRPFVVRQRRTRHSDVKMPSLRFAATPGKKSCVVSAGLRGACTFTWMCFVRPG